MFMYRTAQCYKCVICSKLFYKFNTIPVKILKYFSRNLIDKQVRKCINLMRKGAKSARPVEKTEGPALSDMRRSPCARFCSYTPGPKELHRFTHNRCNSRFVQKGDILTNSTGSFHYPFLKNIGLDPSLAINIIKFTTGSLDI